MADIGEIEYLETRMLIITASIQKCTRGSFLKTS